MEYKEFLRQVEKSVRTRVGDKTQVRVNSIYKNNIRPLDGLTILREGDNVAPAIYLDSYYEQYEEGASMDQIAEEILDYHTKNRRVGRYDVSFYTDFGRVKERIVFRPVHFDGNEELLGQLPYRRFLDLAVIYYYKLDSDVFGNASIMVKKSHMEMWKVTEEELYALAKENTPRLLGYECQDIVELIEEMMEGESEFSLYQEIPMYVLTNAERNFGAAAVLCPDFLRRAGEKLHTDYYVLPSSIHECILIPALPGVCPEELHETVKEINEEHVMPEEVLGDSIYLYCRRTGELTFAYESGRDCL